MFTDDTVICRLVRVWNMWRSGGGMHWRKEGWKSVETRQNTCVWMRARVEVVRLDEFKELGSEILSHGQCTREVKMRVQGGWRWRLVYKVLVRPAVVHGLETLVLTKRQEAELGAAELKMFWFLLRGTGTRLEMSLWEGLGTKSEKEGWDGLDVCRGGREDILERMLSMDEARVQEEDHREDPWMWWRSTCRGSVWQMWPNVQIMRSGYIKVICCL